MSTEKFQWTDELVYEFVNFYDDKCKNKPPWTCEAAEEFKKSKEQKKDFEILYSQMPESASGEGIIKQVRRLSDGEVFTVGDICGLGRITEFIISDFGLYGQMGFGKQPLDKLKKFKQPTPLFTTEDGVDIYLGDTYYHTNDKFYIFKPETAVQTYDEGVLKQFKFFSSKKALEEYILMNKPVLSLQDLLDNWGGVGKGGDNFKSAPMFKYFEDVVRMKNNSRNVQ